MKTVRVVAAVIRAVNKENKPIIFATQRGYGEFKGGWEFPGLQPREATESSRAAGSFQAARLSLVRHRSRR